MHQCNKKAERAVPRCQTKISGVSKTDQSYAKLCDINNIVAQFHRTGKLPESTKIPRFGDFSEVPTLEESFEVVKTAREAFMQLPADIRKLIDNDPSKLENFIADSENLEICQKYGLLEKTVEPEEKTQVKVETSEKPTEGEENVSTETSGKTSSDS